MGRIKLPEKLYRMSDITEFVGLSRQMVHNYLLMGLIKEKMRTRGGHRLFGKEVFAALRKIQSLKKKGWSLSKIAEKFKKERS
ncbi:MAG: MerR family transcriptional regulator [Planctomycetota bacterium]|nr:MerR family transcriptional regulator [Planctomycetota bacterium]